MHYCDTFPICVLDQAVHASNVNSANHCYQRIPILQDFGDSSKILKELTTAWP